MMPVPRRKSSTASSISRATINMRRRSRPVSTYFNKLGKNAKNIMSAKLGVTKSGLRRSTLSLHKMNSSNKRCHEGFDDLRIFIKQGSEFTKELVHTLNERAELEVNYAKGLAKLSAKLFKSAKDMNGTVSNSWHFIAEDMEATAETHKTISNLLVEDLVKPLKLFVDSQHKTRKTLESAVDKRWKTMNEWRVTQAKTKTKSYSNCKENERVQDQVLDCKLGRGRVLSDKELMKLESKRKKSEEAVRKTDLDYYACCLKSERARLEWESAVLRGCSVFRKMEEDRLTQLKTLAEQYHQAMADNRPRLVSSSNRLEEPVQNIDVERDMEAVDAKVEIDPDSMGEQLLPSFYCEDSTNAMNQERRRESLAKFLRVVKSDIEREKKGKAGVENLAKALRETPKFGGEDSQQDVHEKLLHMRSMLTFMEACRYKLLSSLLDLEGRPRNDHPISNHIVQGKDKDGTPKSVLKVPYWSRQDSQPSLHYSSPSDLSLASSSPSLLPDTSDRGMADGGFGFDYAHSIASESKATTIYGSRRGMADGGPVENNMAQNDPTVDGDSSSDFDDFSDGEQVNIIEVVNGLPDDTELGKRMGGPSSVGTSHISSSSGASSGNQSTENEVSEIYFQEKTVSGAGMGQCTAIYDYVANMYDELSIKVGDVINIHDKQADGWWLGELKGTIGIFPATYVEEDSKST